MVYVRYETSRGQCCQVWHKARNKDTMYLVDCYVFGNCNERLYIHIWDMLSPSSCILFGASVCNCAIRGSNK